MMKIPLRIPVIHFQAIWNLNCPLKLGCLCWVLCLQPALSLSALLGDTHGTPANCPPHPAARHTLCQSPAESSNNPWCCWAWALLHRRVWEGSVCALELSAKCQCTEVRKDDSHPGSSELTRDGAGDRIVWGRLGSPLFHDTSCSELLDISPVCSTLLGALCFLTKWAVPMEFNLYVTCLFFPISGFFLALRERGG